jgi:EmrB/QacA subfamily drug resistance transporter
MPDERPEGNPYVALAIILVATFMILLDISIVNVGIPSIQRELHASFAQVQFVVAGYQLAYGVVLITGGRLGDIVGRKRMFMIGVAGFSLASLLCGLSQSGTQIVAARVFQGLMAALMYPQIFSIIRVTFSPSELPTALGILGGVIGVATIAGPLAGGLIIQANAFGLDWRPIFLINLPIGVFAVVAAARYLPESRAPNAPSLDIPGVFIVTVALFLLTFPLVEGRDAGWPWWTFAMLAASAVVMVIFVIYERRREARGRDPLVVSSLFQNRAFVIGLLLFIVFFSGLPSFFLTLNLWLQLGLGFTALHSGLTIVAFAIGSGTASGLSIRLIPRYGKRVLIIGAGLATAGVLLTIYSIHVVGTDLHSWQLIPAMLIGGIGLGLLIAPSLNFVLAGIGGRDVGSASGVLTTVQQVGGALGVAAIGVIFFGQLGSNADRVSSEQVPRIRQQLVAAQLPPDVVDRVIANYRVCFHDRASSKDPTTEPESCKIARQYRPNLPVPPEVAQLPPAQRSAAIAARYQKVGEIVRTTITSSAAQGVAADFTDAVQVALLYNVGAFALSFLLLFMLPNPRNLGGQPAEVAREQNEEPSPRMGPGSSLPLHNPPRSQ